MASLPRDTIAHYEDDGKGNINIIMSELVRCKDCKYYDGDPYWDYCHNPIWGNGHANYSPPCVAVDGFCKWAERRKDG